MGEPPRLTHQSLKLLKLFSDRPSTRLAGSDITRATGLASGTVYPILLRFEAHGLLERFKEPGNPELLGRPLRTYYSLTPDGRALAHQVLSDLAPARLVPRPAVI